MSSGAPSVGTLHKGFTLIDVVSIRSLGGCRTAGCYLQESFDEDIMLIAVVCTLAHGGGRLRLDVHLELYMVPGAPGPSASGASSKC